MIVKNTWPGANGMHSLQFMSENEFNFNISIEIDLYRRIIRHPD